ncbi:lipase maturation factor 2-like isoform X2 [Liolophura sinensis]|uniref:lipase maturation factor 2-like isoform X2 n=1 Tax=Liolophura sinensis TaxID=3198878 RepID=UPI003157F408
MAGVRVAKDLFLWSMSVIYLFAFGSLYVQLPGLFGDNGILPARLVVKPAANSWGELLDDHPTLLRLTPKLGLSTQSAMDLLCLAGIVTSFMCMVFKGLRDTVSFIVLWMLYLSLYHAGQTFLWFQWDILLLETGFLAILVAPLNLNVFGLRSSSYHHHDNITMWLVKWLLFRLMFASGVVKLTSKCPTWWGLTALVYHFETQCIPTPAAWFWSQFPTWLLKLSVVITYFIEIPLPFLFFAPVRCLRLFAFWMQVLLQVLIMITGNYNFFNLLTIVLCFSLLDDELFFRKKASGAKTKRSLIWTILRIISNVVFPLAVFAFSGFFLVKLFGLHFEKDYTIQSNIQFDYQKFTEWLKFIMPYTMWLGVLSLGYEIFISVLRSLKEEKSQVQKVWSLLKVVVFGAVAVGMFSISLVPHAGLEKKTSVNIWPGIRQIHSRTKALHFVNGYGLFRRMTGVGGRPEVIIEGRNRLNGEWKEYEFLYKPGNVSRAPPIVAPHQPRLDWQLWFAALGNYQNNPWFLNLIYRLLTGQKEVLDLIAHNPFPSAPPKYMRATLYHYHFTKDQPDYDGYTTEDWWTRTKHMEYLPELMVQDETFVSYLKSANIIQEGRPPEPSTIFGSILDFIRAQIGGTEGFTFVMSLFGLGIAIQMLNGLFF